MLTTVPAAGAVIATVGGEFTTVTFMADEVAVVPVESKTVAVRVVGPAALGVQAIEYGGVVTAAPRARPLPKNVTDVTVLPRLAAGDAVTAIAVPTVAVELFAGDVRAIEVAVLAVTVTIAEVVEALFESITRAVILKFPALPGTHVTEYGAVVSVPTIVVPARNCTCAIAAPAPGVAVADRVTFEPIVTTAPAAGPVTLTVGAAGEATDTATTEEVEVAPFESVTRAVSETEPAAAGVQLTV